MSRNGGVRDALARLKLKHHSIIERRKKDRVATNKASTLAGPSSPAKQVGKNSLAELDSHLSRTSSSNSSSPNPTMPSVAEWLLWGDEDEQAGASSAAGASGASSTPSTPSRASTTTTTSSPPKTRSSPQSSSPNSPLNTITPIAESHSFDHSQFSSHFYSEMTDDYTADESMEDVTLASSKEPGLLAHGLMAIHELFSSETPPSTPSPTRRRRRTRRSRTEPRPSRRTWEDRSLMEFSDDEEDEDEDDDSTTITFSKDSPSVTTATTASSSPSNLFGETNIDMWSKRTHSVNIIDSSTSFGMEEVEMSLETVTRIEI